MGLLKWVLFLLADLFVLFILFNVLLNIVPASSFTFKYVDALDHAEKIASEDLRMNYAERGILAGKLHFNDYWARDGFFASFGALSIGDYDIVKKQLELFSEYQDDFGMIPLRVQTGNLALRFVRINIPFVKFKPVYFEDKKGNIALDSNCLFVISGYEYYKKTEDDNFLKDHFYNFEKAVSWLRRFDTDNNKLLEEDNYAGWTDSLKKKGEVLYTNVCYYKSISDLSVMAEIVGESEKAEFYSAESENVKEAIDEHFWNGNYYDDVAEDVEASNMFSSDGNLLAIVWNVSSQEQSENILESAKKFGLEEYFTTRNSLKYPSDMKSEFLWWVGLQDYHDGLLWIWIGALDAAAKEKAGMHEEAVERLELLSEKIAEYRTVYEVYDLEGEPVKRVLYTSEHPFSWSAGMYLWAFSQVNG